MKTDRNQGNDNPIQKALTSAGIAAADIDSIVAAVPYSSNKPLVEKACAGGNHIEIALAIAVLLAGRLREKNDNLTTLLSYLADQLPLLDMEHRGMYWHIKGYTSWRWLNSLYPAIPYLNLSEECLKRAQTETADFYLARVYDTFGQISYLDGHFAGAKADYEKALGIRDQFNDHYGKALTYGNLGRLHLAAGNFPAAFAYFKEDLGIIETFYPELARVRVQLLSHLSSCLARQNKLAEARTLLIQSRSLAEREEDFTGQFFAAIGLGHIARVGGRIADAAVHRDAAQAIVDLRDELQKTAYLGLINYLHATILTAETHYAEAMPVFALALDQYENSPSLSAIDRAQLLMDYAEVARKVKESEAAAMLLKQALNYLDATTASEMRNKVEEELRLHHKQSWLEHFIKRFTGLGKAEFLLEEIGHAGYRGKKCDVAILVTDIRGFTGITEDLDPDVLIPYINEYFTRMIRCVEHFEGYVDKIIGDAVMCIFTVPQPQPNDAERAIHSALLMQETLKKFNGHLPPGMPPLRMGLGIHYGKVVAGMIGSPSKRSYTIVGDTVNTAFRIEGMTKLLGVSLLVTEEFRSQLQDQAKYLLRPLGCYCPRGRRDSVSVYEFIGEKEHCIDLPEVEAEITRSAYALDLLYQRRFPEAIPLFDDLYRNTGIAAYQILSDEARSFQTTPPPESWEGEIVLRSK